MTLVLGACGHSYFGKGYLEKPAEKVVSDSIWMDEGLVFIRARVNGVEGNFLIDNGFSSSGMDAAFMKKCQLKFKGQSGATDANNQKVSLAKGKVRDIEIAGFHFKKTKAYQIDTKVFFPCYSVDGVIGASIINKANWHFNFKAKKLRISTEPFELDGQKIPAIYYSNNRAGLPLRIKGIEVNCRVDLGMSAAMKLRMRDFKTALQGEEAKFILGSTSISVGGLAKPDTVIETKEAFPIYNGDEKLEEPTQIRLQKKIKYPATVGMGYLKRYELVINTDNSEYILKPQSKSAAEVKGYSAGLYHKKGQVVLVATTMGSSYSLPLEVGDTVNSINGLSADSIMDICDLKSALQKHKKQEDSLSLEIKGKGRIILPFEEPIYLAIP